MKEHLVRKTMQTLTARPYQLMCLFCRLGRRDRQEAYYHEERLDEIQAAVKLNPIVPLTLCCNTDTVYQYQNPGREFDTPEGAAYNDLRDLAVLRKLGAVPGATRPAVDFLDRIPAAIPACSGICAYPAAEAPGWPACRFAATGNYERGLAQGVDAFIHRRSPAEKQAAKKASCKQCYGAARLRIRPHHLLCMTCFHKGRSRAELAPIQADNLFECIDIMQKNPEIPVELIAGPCMVCPPCTAYHPASNLCIGGRSMGLRDQKKDLDTLRRIGARYGDVLPARELLRRLYAAIHSTKEVCGCGDGPIRSAEWDGCGREGLEAYVQGRAAGLGVPGVACCGGTVRMPAKDGDHQRMAEELVREAHAGNGLAPVDLKRFWADQKEAALDPFGAHIPQVPIAGCMVSVECLFDELGIPEDWRRHYHDRAWVAQLSKAYNDKAVPIIGRRPLSEDPGDPTRVYPATAGLEGLFEAKKIWQNESYWLMPSAHTEDELKALLDRVKDRLANLRAHLLPPNWDREKKRLMALGVKPPAYRSQRGPVTFATSVYGIENLIYLMADNPDLAQRFSRLILETMLGIARVMDEEAGYTPDTTPHGFSFLDDNCCLLTPAMYELFGYPVLKGIFEQFCPKPGDRRYQHSDSAMGHLLPVIGRLGLTGVNFGPTVTVTEIREHLPRAIIYGQLAPFTYSRNDEIGIVREFLRDIDQARAKRGLVFATAGSINNGTRLTGARLIMAAVQRYGRYG